MSNPSHNVPAATYLDVERLLGPLDTDTIMAVMKLSPTLQDIEKAALHAAGEGEALPDPHQPHGTVLAIIELVTRDEEDERRTR
jgi:hypothetical protein